MREPTGEAAWRCFTAAAAAYGLPRQLLSDNGSIFTGRFLGLEVAFERRLRELDVDLITAAPGHPQTLGKLERFHRTLKEWLQDEGPASDLEQLQLLLDRFRPHYNEERPHQGIADRTPLERYTEGWAGTGALAAPVPADEPEPSASSCTSTTARSSCARSRPIALAATSGSASADHGR